MLLNLQHKTDQCCPITKQMTLMSQLFIVNLKKQRNQLCSFYWTNETSEPIFYDKYKKHMLKMELCTSMQYYSYSFLQDVVKIVRIWCSMLLLFLNSSVLAWILLNNVWNFVLLGLLAFLPQDEWVASEKVKRITVNELNVTTFYLSDLIV